MILRIVFSCLVIGSNRERILDHNFDHVEIHQEELPVILRAHEIDHYTSVLPEVIRCLNSSIGTSQTMKLG